MTPTTAQKVARATLTPAIVAVAILVAILVVDWALHRRWTALEDERIAALEQRVERDARVEPVLSVERDWQTTRTLYRKHRVRTVSLLLTLASALLVTAAKILGSTRPIPSPSLEELVAIRFPTPDPGPPGGSRHQEPDPAQVDEIVAAIGAETHHAIAILQEIQRRFGYLPDEALARVAETTAATPAQLAGTSSFYTRFRRTPPGEHLVRICHGTACHVAGARHIEDELRRHLEIPDHEDTDRERRFTLTPVACLGCCSLAPVIMVDERTAGRLSPATARAALGAARSEDP